MNIKPGTASKLAVAVIAAAIATASVSPALAQTCTRQGNDVSCDDGRRGVFTGDAIIWPDGTRSNLASQHPSVIVGHKQSVIIGQGVMVGSGSGKGMVPMENPAAQTRCPTLDGVPYCN